MPLDPKQLPPYYTPGANGPLANKFLRIHTQQNVVVTSGTGEEDLYLYTIPANTLQQDGDGLEIYYQTINNTDAVNHITRFYFHNNLQLAVTEAAQGSLLMRIQITRQTSSIAYLIMQVWSPGNDGESNIQNEISVDYTTTIPIKFTGQAAATATIQAELLTIDKQLK